MICPICAREVSSLALHAGVCCAELADERRTLLYVILGYLLFQGAGGVGLARELIRLFGLTPHPAFAEILAEPGAERKPVATIEYPHGQCPTIHPKYGRCIYGARHAGPHYSNMQTWKER